MRLVKPTGFNFISFLFFLFYCLVSHQAVAQPTKLTVQQAHHLSSQGEVLLIDIRSEQEWQQTGISPHAVTLSMHQKGGVPQLTKELLKLLSGNKNKPIALICAGGVRSARVQKYLIKQGFTQVADVPEGMIGSWFSEGWIEQDLPLINYINQKLAM